MCSCGPKSKPADKEDSKEGDDKDEEPKLKEAVWEAKLKFLQVTRAVFSGKPYTQDILFWQLSALPLEAEHNLACTLLIQIQHLTT